MGRWLEAQRRDGGALGRLNIPGALDVEADQGAADRRGLADFAVQGGDNARDRGRQLDGGLVGHDLRNDFALLDPVTDRL